MRLRLAVLLAALALPGCTSVEIATVSHNEIAAQNGDAMAVIQTNAIGFSLFLYYVDFVNADLDIVVNRLLVSEAKAMGASKVTLLSFETTPRHNIYRLKGLVIGLPYARAAGVAVR
jgi:hypothetical protein